MSFLQSYPSHGWSAGHWPQSFYYDAYSNPQAYSQPPHYGQYMGGQSAGYPYPGNSPPSRRGALTPPVTSATTPYPWSAQPASFGSTGELHRLLGGRLGTIAIWDVSQPFTTAQRISSRGRLEPIPARIRDHPAKHPAVRDMRILLEPFGWDMEIHIPFREAKKVVTVGVVLDCIYSTLQEPLEPDEWVGKSVALQKKIYGVMCKRIRTSRPSIKADGHILRIDCLLGKTRFTGLKQVGSSGEWELKLAHQRNS